MARPHYEEGQERARDRIVAAFWTALEERPYDKVTVKLVTDLAGVNKNTFYYHFETMDDLAKEAVRDAFSQLPIEKLLAGDDYFGAVTALIREGRVSPSKIQLIGHDGSGRLTRMLEDVAMAFFASRASIDPTKLTLHDHIIIRALLSAILSFAREATPESFLERFSVLYHSKLAQGGIEEVRAIVARTRLDA